MSICSACGTELSLGARYCRTCGTQAARDVNPPVEARSRLHVELESEVPGPPLGSSNGYTCPLPPPRPQSVLTKPPQERRRSIAWVWYSLLTLGAVLGAFSHPALVLVVPLLGLYALYLFRGGRFVIWFW